MKTRPVKQEVSQSSSITHVELRFSDFAWILEQSTHLH